ncbi:MAG: F0F1 ATP synthase subunit A [Bacteroidales bacterium]|nr:F0F1 ATP synthase subunit A [Bacteroidales bacterium]
MSRKIISYILGALFFFLIVAAKPQQHQTENSAQQPQEHVDEQHGDDQNQADDQHEVGFNPGEFIFDHIGDAHEWHILTYKDFHLSLPLPVILYSKSKGLNVFLFSKFHHGHDDYKGFRFELHGDNKGKIVEILDDGSVQPPSLNLSFTKNAFAILVSCLLLLWLFLSVARAYKKRPDKAPTGMQNLVEPIILFIRDDIAIPSIGEKKAERFLPFLLSIFFFIYINNMMGLIPIFPGGANVTGNITVTIVLALFTFSVITINGNKEYWTHIFNPPGVPWWLKFPVPLMPIIEIVGMFTKPFVLMVRLFANISAGHIIAMGFFSLIFIFGQMQVAMGYLVSPLTLAFTIFMIFLELLVALIQAYVFTLLSAIYFGMAVEEHH